LGGKEAPAPKISTKDEVDFEKKKSRDHRKKKNLQKGGGGREGVLVFVVGNLGKNAKGDRIIRVLEGELP